MMPERQQQDGVLLSSVLAGLPAADDVLIKGLALDSRQLEPGWAFLAIAGHQQHGLRFYRAAVEAGAIVVVYDPAGEGEQLATSLPVSLLKDCPVIAVPELAERLGGMASHFYGEPSLSLSVIGLTGTNGKTSCSHFMAQALSARQAAAVIGTMGWGLPNELRSVSNTTPDAVSVQSQLATLLDEGAAYVAMEVSSHGLEQGRVNGVRFTTAVFTNLSRDHLDYHGSMQAYGAAKRRLFVSPGLQSVVLNLGDEFAEAILNVVESGVQTWGYSSKPVANPSQVDALLLASNIQQDDAGLSFTVSCGAETVGIQSAVIGRFNVDNLLATMAVLMIEGSSLIEAAGRASTLRGIPGRMERFGQAGLTPTVIVDYAHTEDALKSALTSLQPHCRGRLLLVFGCGGDRDQGKRSLMGQVAEQYADQIWLTDDNPRSEDPTRIVDAVLSGMQNPDLVSVVHDRQQAIQQAIQLAQADDVVLVAGKGHETTQLKGDEVLPFSDRDCVEAALLGRAPTQNGGGARCL